MHLIGVLEKEEKKNREEKLFEELMMPIFQTLMKNNNPQF